MSGSIALLPFYSCCMKYLQHLNNFITHQYYSNVKLKKPYSRKQVVFQERFGNIWDHSKKALQKRVGVAEKQTETNKVTDTTSIRTFFLQNR